MSEDLHVVLPRQFFWWGAIAMRFNPRYALFSRIILWETPPMRPVTHLAVSSHFQGDENCLRALCFAPDAEVILWDGLQDLNKWRTFHGSGCLDHVRFSLVGQNKYLPKGPAYNLLFAQETEQYSAVTGFRSEDQEIVVGARSLPKTLALRWRRPLITLKHAIQQPSDLLRRSPRVIFAGQSGRVTLEALAPRANPFLVKFLADVRVFESNRSPVLVDLHCLVKLLVVDFGIAGHEWYLMAKALTRILTLAAIHESGLPCAYTFYPKGNVNVYQSRLLTTGYYLDFGGMNGDEVVYPRCADLLIAGKRYLRVVAPAAALYPNARNVSVEAVVAGLTSTVEAAVKAARGDLEKSEPE